MLRDYLKNIRNSSVLKKSARGGIIEKPLKIRGAEYIHCGRNFKLRKGFRIECIASFAGEKLSPELEIGDNVIIGYNFTALVTEKISIGDNALFAGNVLMTTENHGIDPESELPYSSQPLISKGITIGKNVWIGQNAVILPGVEIGDNSIIAAGSIVTKSVPPCCIAAGNPARVIKQYDFERHEWKKPDAGKEKT